LYFIELLSFTVQLIGINALLFDPEKSKLLGFKHPSVMLHCESFDVEYCMEMQGPVASDTVIS